MTKKTFFGSFFVLLAAGLTMTAASCTNEDENIVTPDEKGLVSVEICGGINDGRTHLDGLNVEFDSNDELAVWDGVEKRRFKTDAGGSVALFNGEIAENASQLNILYPYSAGQGCASGTITATIPAKQTTTKDSFDPSANLAVATATYTKGQNITCTLENVCGLLKFTIANDAPKDSYDSIKIAGKNGEMIAGTVTITNKQIAENSGDAAAVTLGDATKKLKKDSTYYVVLKPGTFADGLTLTFYSGGAQVDEPMDIANSEGKVEIKTGVILNAKEVKPEKPEPVFSVSSTTKVKFAPGNMIYDVTNKKWGFFENQYDYATSYSSTLISLFTWGYGDWSTDPSTTSYGYSFTDWGPQIGDGKPWRTLSQGEWNHILYYRDMPPAGRRYDDISVTIDSKTYHGLFIYPDSYAGAFVGNSGANTWEAINTAGIVFLPCAGKRDGKKIDNLYMDKGWYFTTSVHSFGLPHILYLYFSGSGEVHTDRAQAASTGLSVRLAYNYVPE